MAALPLVLVLALQQPAPQADQKQMHPGNHGAFGQQVPAFVFPDGLPQAFLGGFQHVRFPIHAQMNAGVKTMLDMIDALDEVGCFLIQHENIPLSRFRGKQLVHHARGNQENFAGQDVIGHIIHHCRIAFHHRHDDFVLPVPVGRIVVRLVIGINADQRLVVAVQLP